MNHGEGEAEAEAEEEGGSVEYVPKCTYNEHQSNWKFTHTSTIRK